MVISVARGWQGQCWRRSLENLGRSNWLKKLKNTEKVKWGPPTDRRTDIAGCRVAWHMTKDTNG